jgi:membrane protein YqaA with SNARE-associated domain
MDPDALIAAVGLYAATFVIAVVGAVVPIISIEVFLIAIAIAVGPADAVPLVALAAVGQTLGKLPIYFGTRAIADRAKLDRIRAWAARWRPSLLLATSSTLGLPPFSMLATAAGVLAIPPRMFCSVVVVGRAVRFTAIFVLASR